MAHALSANTYVIVLPMLLHEEKEGLQYWHVVAA